MSLYERFEEAVRRRRLTRASSLLDARQPSKSSLIKNLAAEISYAPPYSEDFGYELRQKMDGPRREYIERRNERRRERERLALRRDELLRVVAEAKAALEGATAFTPLDEVALAESKLSAGHFLLNLTSEPAGGDEGFDPIQAGEEIRSAAAARLQEWRAILSRELERLRGEIEELERGGGPLDLGAGFGPHVRILEELDALSAAKSDADRCFLAAHALKVEWARLEPEGDGPAKPS